MLVPLSWLNDYVDINVSADELEKKLFDCGFEVEEKWQVGKDISGIVVGYVESCEPIPETHLHVCQVNVGGPELLQICCGADNVKAGGKFPVAMVGAQVYATAKDHVTIEGVATIKKGKLRGYESYGMLCSGTELGLNEDLYPGAGYNGLLVLPEDAEIGADVKVLVKGIIEEAKVAGIFYSVQNAEENRFTYETYRKYITPPEKEVLDYANTLSDMNVLHCCGWEGIPNRLEDWADYKTAVVSWARYIEGLDVKEAKEKLNENKQNAQQQIEEAKQEIENGKNKIEKAEVKLNSSKKEADTKFKSAYNQIQMAKESIFQNETQLNQKEQEAGQQITELEIKKQELQTQFDTIENNLTQLETQYNQIKDNPNISEEQKQMLENKIQMLKQSKQTIKAGIEQINNGITTGKQEIENAKTQLQNAKNELTKKEKQYEATKTATYSSLENAKIEIEKSKTELEKGEKELEEKQEEFKDKIADAESKLIDSREKIANIENPTWYVLDRYSNTGYNSFIQDTESIENISKVFPIVFFMVALLISLTSMTRMVEEQRTQIGTLKALGYNKLQIASKYVIYAGLACVIGGVLGMSVGFVLLPQIIWTMYQMMYQMTDNIHISFNIIIGGMGLLLICVCIIGATIYAVLKELVQTPSTLMRPKAPKMGKRVLLEKIPFIWKRLSFSQKVTVRNIFRYKKRFLMTIIGILGCTALIVVGFGVRDSIRCIMPNQFEKVFNYDMQIGLKNGLEDEQKQKYIISLQEKTELEKVVETYMTSNIAKNQENEEDVQIIVPKEPKDLDEVINLTDVKTGEKVQLEENAICLTDKVAELLNVKQGDTITLKDSKDKERQVKISNIVENYVYHYVYMSRITYENLYGENYNTNMLFTKNNNLSEEQETNLATEIMNQSEVASISRNSSIMNLLDDTMKSLNYVVIILIVSAGLLAFVVLYNLSNVNISERIRELATIKVLGFYDKEVYSYVTRETVILTAIGIVLGLIGGYFLNYFIIRNL